MGSSRINVAKLPHCKGLRVETAQNIALNQIDYSSNWHLIM